MSTQKCSLCEYIDTLSDAEKLDVEGLLATESSRTIASILPVGKSTVNRHRLHSGSNADTGLVWNRPDEGIITVQVDNNTDYASVLASVGRTADEVELVSENHRILKDGSATHSYRFKAKKAKPIQAAVIDPVQILEALRANKPTNSATPGRGDGAFVISLNDTQLGKAEGGGTVATLARVSSYIAQAKVRIAELRAAGRSLGELVIIGGGDIIEGCAIYPNQSYTLDLDRRGQINTAVSVILEVIDELAPLFSKVTMLVTRGNHGENRLNGSKTTLYDNDDTLVFEMARQATARDAKLKHVRYIIANEEAGVYVDVAGWRLATTHGDIFAKFVGGATQDRKAQNWYKNMAAGRDPMGEADVLVTHHFHHNKMSDWGACLWRQTPAMDGGSEYFRQSSGEYSEPGMLTFCMSPDNRYHDEQVLW
jgi:hypothetical protein